jgi:hypothetical protein
MQIMCAEKRAKKLLYDNLFIIIIMTLFIFCEMFYH